MQRAAIVIAMALGLGMAACGNPAAASNPSTDPLSHSVSAPSVAAPAGAKASAPQPLEILSVLSVEKAVDVTAQRDGVVLTTESDEGSVVRTGQELARLDDSTLEAELQKAQSDLLVSENNVKYKQAEQQAKNAQLKRQQLLRASGLSSDADLEQAQFEAKGAGYELDSWRQEVKSSQAQINELQIEIAKTRIGAPFSGVLVRRYIRQGQQVAKNDKCFRVSQLGPLEVEFQIPETAGQRPASGAVFTLELAEDVGQAYSARVDRVSPTVDPASDSYDVVARLIGSNSSGLRPGMSVRISWPAAEARASQ
ncbi:MAG TPA: efflux RND transporter periplasmic adaptor subunit [Candidatus Acidoferrales bacterium]|nr:efflux RND transporter periplasmic adaptor subunit [Candidatus Acidoferrales bacterium]